jgi:hypothetical protein
MKAIRMAVLGAALVFGVTTVASAQGGGAGGGQARGGGRGNQVARLMTDITVSADVQARIDTIAAKYQTQTRELMTAGGGAQMDDATRAKMMDLNTKRNAEIRALLSAEQAAQFDKNVAAMPAGGRRGGGAAGAPPPPPPPAL